MRALLLSISTDRPRQTDMNETSNLTRSIAQQLGVAIVTGEYSAAEPFPVEAALCQKFGASRTALREAIKMLTAKGLLSARPRQGTRVELEQNWNLLDPDVLRWMLARQFSLPLLAEFTEIRLAIEPVAASMAAQHAEPAAIGKIDAAMERMRAADRGEDDPLESDIAFHLSILQASGNRFYVELSDFIETALRFSIRFTNRYKGVQLADVGEHYAILEAICAGAPEAAQTASRNLIAKVLELINLAQAREQSEQS